MLGDKKGRRQAGRPAALTKPRALPDMSSLGVSSKASRRGLLVNRIASNRRSSRYGARTWTTPPSLSGELMGTLHAYRAGALEL